MIIFRVDGNKQIGTGHVMRCLSIADAFSDMGIESVFVLADDNVQNIVSSRGFRTIILGTDYDSMDTEFPLLEMIILKLKPDQIIVDSYFVTESYLLRLRGLSFIIYIDDIVAFPYPVDKLVDYNIYADKKNYEEMYYKACVNVPELLLGIKYAPLRREFRDIPRRMQPKRCYNIFFSTGGTDPIHLTLACIEYLRDLSVNYRFHFILGAMNPDREKIVEISEGISNVSIYHNIKDMKELMLKCDLAVSAAGSTLYELCACGLPGITYVLADNQILGAEAFERSNLMLFLGDFRYRESPAEVIFKAIEELDNNYEKRNFMAENMQELIDGYGSDRLAKELL